MLRTARDLMQKSVISIGPTETLRELAQILDDEGIHGMPVVDTAGNPVGVVSRSDLVHAMSEDEPAERPTSHYYAVYDDEVIWNDDESGTRLADSIESERQVAEIMSDHVLATEPNATAGKLARKMAKFGVRRLLVLERGKLVGIVSATDLLRCLELYERALTAASARKNGAKQREAPRSKKGRTVALKTRSAGR
jgi:CBS domain-containing protein